MQVAPSGELDCAIIGGGAAGLAAATYLGRFRRNVLVIDAGATRVRRIPLARNVPGWPEGVGGAALHDLMVQQALRYGARITKDKVETIRQDGDAFIVAATHTVRAKTVLIATGSCLNEPSIDRLEYALARGIIRYCPVCDGYECEGKRVAVLGRKPNAIEEALFLRSLATDITFLCESTAAQLSLADRDRAKAAQISYIAAPVISFAISDSNVAVKLAGGDEQHFDVLYPCLGCAPQSALLKMLGCDLSETGGVRTDRHQLTNVASVYAAGDVMEGLDQIASAWGQAAIAAVAIHNELRERTV